MNVSALRIKGSIPKQMAFWPIMLVVFSGAFLSVLNTSLINIAIPSLLVSFDSTISTMQWTLTGFMLATGLSAPLSGYLGDRFGLRNLYIFVLVGVGVASCFCALAWSPLSLILFRMIQGFFCGIIMPITMTIIYQMIHPDKHAFALSIWSVAAWMGPAIGPTFAGLILQYSSWHWLFLLNCPLVIVSVIFVFNLLPREKVSSKVSLDISGLIFVLYCSIAFLLAFSEIGNWGWLNWKTVLLMATGIATFGVFIHRQLTVANPLLNLKVFQDKQFMISVVISCVISASLFAGVYMVPLFMQTVQGVSPLETGLTLLPASAVMLLVMPVVGKLVDRVGVFRLAFFGLVVILFSQWKLSQLTLDVSSSYIMYWMMIRNIGIAIASVPITNAGMKRIPKHLVGHASAVNNWTRQVISSLAISLFTTLLAWRQVIHLKTFHTSELPSPDVERLAMAEGINDVFWVSGLLILISLPLIIGFRKKTIDQHSLVREGESKIVND